MAKQFRPRTGSRGIEWTDRTIGVFGGCLHDCKWTMPDGTTAICYAKSLAESGVAQSAYPHGFEHHYFRELSLKQLHSTATPEMIFVDSMSDMFAHNVPSEQIHQMFDAMRRAPQHVFQSLTKAAPQLLKYTSDMPPNLWVGVSSPPDWFLGKHLSHTAQQKMLKRSLDVLQQVKQESGNIVWMSAEPVSWDLTTIISDSNHPLDWIVIGAASNGRQYFQPDVEHIRRLLTVMDMKKTPVFFKGNIKPLFKSNDLGSSLLNRWREDFPRECRNGNLIPAVEVRQENCRKHGWTLSGVEQISEDKQRSLF
jgi:protein gp37